MNEPPDPLEAELRAFRPPDVSAESRQRIASRLASSSAQRDRQGWRIALVGAPVAACLGALFLGWGVWTGGHRPAVVGPPITRPVQSEDALPSLRAYRQALARSPDDLDALLDQHAARASRPDPQLVRIRAFNQPDLQLRAFSGEL